MGATCPWPSALLSGEPCCQLRLPWGEISWPLSSSVITDNREFLLRRIAAGTASVNAPVCFLPPFVWTVRERPVMAQLLQISEGLQVHVLNCSSTAQRSEYYQDYYIAPVEMPVSLFNFWFIHFVLKMNVGDLPGGLVVKNPPANTGTQVCSLVQENSSCPRGN